MNADDTKKALLAASRAYARAMRAKTCGEAGNNLRLGQKLEQRARDAMRELLPKKLEFRHWSPERKELLALVGHLPNAEMNAHLHRLTRCGVTQLQWEQQAAAERARVAHGPEKARERQGRKRPKRRP